MSRTKLGLYVLGAAAVLGVLGDGLLRATPWGSNVPLWIAALILVGLALGRLGDRGFREGEWWLAPLALVFASFTAWRDAPMLVFLNVSTVIAALSLFTIRGRRGSLKTSGISEYVLGSFYAGLCVLAGPTIAAAKDVQWREVAQGRWQSVVVVTRGLLIAAPLLFIFGGLFVAADAVFEELVRDVFGFDLGEILGHLLLAGLVAWISAGLLRLTFLGREPDWTSPGRTPGLSLGATEIGVTLGLLNLLFLTFVVIQIRYLFGGVDAVSVTGLTYAEYARRGFFELVAVTALVLPLLLAADWLLRPEDQARKRIFKILSVALLALLLIIVASALYRMWLYLQEFGLTELRLYTTAFMAWLGVVLCWFTVTVLLRGRRDRFAYGALLSGFAAVILLNAVNPDSVIARVNVSRLQEGERFDPYYLTTLSADAAPVLVEVLPRIGDELLYEGTGILPYDEEEQPIENPMVREAIVDRYESEASDWRTWNFSRWRAQNLVQDLEVAPG